MSLGRAHLIAFVNIRKSIKACRWRCSYSFCLTPEPFLKTVENPASPTGLFCQGRISFILFCLISNELWHPLLKAFMPWGFLFYFHLQIYKAAILLYPGSGSILQANHRFPRITLTPISITDFVEPNGYSASLTSCHKVFFNGWKITGFIGAVTISTLANGDCCPCRFFLSMCQGRTVKRNPLFWWW